MLHFSGLKRQGKNVLFFSSPHHCGCRQWFWRWGVLAWVQETFPLWIVQSGGQEFYPGECRGSFFLFDVYPTQSPLEHRTFWSGDKISLHMRKHRSVRLVDTCVPGRITGTFLLFLGITTWCPLPHWWRYKPGCLWHSWGWKEGEMWTFQTTVLLDK